MRALDGQKVLLISTAVLALWAGALYLGLRLPYLRTEFGLEVRAYVVFPVLLVVLLYFAFVYKNEKSGGRTGLQIKMAALPTRRKRWLSVLTFLAASALMCAFVAWSATIYPAFAAELTAATPFAQTYTVENIRVRGGFDRTAFFDLALRPRNGSDQVGLNLGYFSDDKHQWKRGDTICARGRTSIFGTIIDATSRGSC